LEIPLHSVSPGEVLQEYNVSLADFRICVCPLPLQLIPAFPAEMPSFRLPVMQRCPSFGEFCDI
jgi:hypothetical protein